MAKRRLKIAFHVEDMDMTPGSRIILGPDQTIVEFDDAALGDIGPCEAAEILDAAGLTIARYIRARLWPK